MNNNPKSEWVVHTKGVPDPDPWQPWEICVIRRDNCHGFISFGWFGPEKIFISHNGGPCRDIVSKEVWKGLLALAAKEAKRLNKLEKYGNP